MFCEPCKEIRCTNPEDSTTYSLQSGLVFTSGVLVGTVASCPQGFTCSSGIIPFVKIYDDDDWTIPVNPKTPVDGGQLILRGCSSDIVRTVPPNTSTADLQAIVNEMFQDAANQQALCDATDGDEPGITPNPPPPPEGAFAMSTFVPTTACLSTSFSAQVFATSDATFSIIGSLPPGLVLSQSGATATISGVPTTAGTTVFVIHAVSGTDTASQQVTFDVVGITTASPLPGGTEGAAYSQTLSATGMSGTLTWAVLTGSLPPGLSLNTATGEISGNVTAGSAGVYSFVITVIN